MVTRSFSNPTFLFELFSVSYTISCIALLSSIPFNNFKPLYKFAIYDFLKVLYTPFAYSNQKMVYFDLHVDDSV